MEPLPTLSFDSDSHPERLRLDLDRLIASRLLVQASSGGGKSRALRALLEGTWGRVQQIVLDPEGEFSSLREAFPFVLAGPDGDVPATPETAGMLCRKLLELRASCVVNLYDLSPDDRRLYVRRFLEELMLLPREFYHPLLVVLDEAHLFAPQVGTGTAQSAQAVISLASQGRKRGYCLVAATQRLSKLHKDVAAELLNKLIGRTGLDVDLKRAADELGFDKSEAANLKRLEPGQFYAYGPALSPEVSLIRTGEVRTSHPEIGALGVVAPPAPAELREVLAALAELPREAQTEARTNEELQKKLEQVQAQLSLERSTKAALPVEVREVVKEVPALAEEEIERLEAKAHDMKALGKDLHALGMDILAHLSSWKKVPAPIVLPVPVPVSPPAPKPTSVPTSPVPDGDLSAPQRRILKALADFESLGLQSVKRSNVAAWSDQSPTSGGYTNNLGALRSRGLITYPDSTTVALTELGRAQAPASEPLTLADLHGAWFARLPRRQSDILKHLIAIYPKPIERVALAELTGQSPTSGGYSNNLGALRSLGLLDYPSPTQAVATSLLFPAGLK